MKMRSKLMATSLMLVVSILMMTTASFAWFTISTAPEVKGITATAVTNQNLEIVLDKGQEISDTTSATKDNYTWGNLVNLDGTAAYQGASDYSTFLSGKTIRPAKLNAGTFQKPQYGEDGRLLTDFANLTVVEDAASAFGVVNDGTDVYAYYIDFKVRANKAATLTFSNAVQRAAGDSLGTDTGAGSGVVEYSADNMLHKSIRVATQLKGGTITEASVANGKFSGTIGSLTANEATTLRVFIYIDGTEVTNVMGTLSSMDVALNLQFAATEIANPMDVPATSTT